MKISFALVLATLVVAAAFLADGDILVWGS
jgi:hypothetical protein